SSTPWTYTLSLHDALPILNQLLDQRRGEIATLVDRKAQAEAENAESRQAIDRLQREREQVSAQTAELIARRDLLGNDITGREDRSEEHTSELQSRFAFVCR